MSQDTSDTGLWLRSRGRALLRAWRATGLPWRLAAALTVACLAHLAVETGWGRGEVGFNPGNLHAGTGWTGPTRDRLDGGRTYLFRAYRSLDEGVTDYVQFLLRPRYAAAFARFVADGDAVAWFRAIGRAGYYGGGEPTVQVYAGVFARLNGAA